MVMAAVSAKRLPLGIQETGSSVFSSKSILSGSRERAQYAL
jgi:hypothetical protein